MNKQKLVFLILTFSLNFPSCKQELKWSSEMMSPSRRLNLSLAFAMISANMLPSASNTTAKLIQRNGDNRGKCVHAPVIIIPSSGKTHTDMSHYSLCLLTISITCTLEILFSSLSGSASFSLCCADEFTKNERACCPQIESITCIQVMQLHHQVRCFGKVADSRRSCALALATHATY